MRNHDLAPCQAMVSIEDGEPIAEQIQLHVDRLPNEALVQATKDLKAHIDATSAMLAVYVREVDRRQLPAVEDRLSTAGWLRHHTRMTPAQASAVTKTARSLAHMPTIVEGALSGNIPQRSLHLLSQARSRYPEEFPQHEEVFAEVATYLNVKDLRTTINHWEQQVNYPKALKDATYVSQLRSAYLSESIDGTGDLQATLTPEGYTTVKTALGAYADPLNLDPSDHRTPTQRRSDALVDIHRFWLDHNTKVTTSAGEKPHITVTVDYRVLTGELQELPNMNGSPVAPASIRTLACDAGIIPAVMGSPSEPLDVGRKTRTIPSALRRAIELRDEHCTWQGCLAPRSWCDVHHNQHWANGGATSLANCRLLCRKHHSATHQIDEADHVSDAKPASPGVTHVRPAGNRSPPIP